MFASLEQLLGEVLANITGSLAMVMSWNKSAELYDLHPQWPPSRFDWSETYRIFVSLVFLLKIELRMSKK